MAGPSDCYNPLMRIRLLLVSSICMLFCAGGHAQRRPTHRELKVITLSGSGYERGLQHGRQLKADIAAIIGRWRANTLRGTERDPAEVLEEFFEYARFTDAIRKWTPDLYDEVRGIAEGSGQRLEDILVLNLLDEFWVYLDDPGNHHCSGVGIPGSNGQPAYVSQNMDLETYTDGFQVLMRITREGNEPEQLILTHAGLIGLNGMNENGVGVCVNTLMQLRASPSGLPVAFVVRGLISRTDKHEVLSFINGVVHASGQNYIIGIGDEVLDFEASANQVVRFQPEGVGGAVFHTNHALVNGDIKPWYVDQSEPYSENSLARLEAVRSRVASEDFQGGSSLGAIFRSKDDPAHPVCRSNLNSKSFTFASVIMTLGKRPSLQLTVGPPDESEYQTFHFVKAGE